MVTDMTNKNELPLAENIRFLQRSRSYTRAQLAGFIGVKTATLSAWLDGRSRPRIEELLGIADHFKITLDVLVRTDMKRWYIVRTGFKLEKIVEQGPKLVIKYEKGFYFPGAAEGKQGSGDQPAYNRAVGKASEEEGRTTDT